ncbi:MAG: hypothetical protein D3M94_21650 [Rhodocyclales bacterium GT-UBC]|nr:MAG: hypothetical protein D3M94_21650 [Rhodocyclales bacterium GT-UBC]
MLFAIQLRYERPAEAIKQQLEAHKNWLIRYIQTGKILFAGPLPQNDGGFLLAHGAAESEIENMIAEDPFVAHQLVSFTILGCEPAIRAAAFPAHWAAAAKAV